MAHSDVAILGRMGSGTVLDDVERELQSFCQRVVRWRSASDVSEGQNFQPDVIIAAAGLHCSRELMARMPHLRGVVSPATGIEQIDVTAATDLGIIVANGQTPENTNSMAEATILLMLAALYDLHGSEAVLRQGLARPPVLNARMLSGKKIGMIGFGQIARAMAARLETWDVQILASVRRVPPNAPSHVTFVELEELLRTCDVVCVLTTLNASSERLLDADRLRLLKPEAVLVNTARGAIIDEHALYHFAVRRPDVRLALDTFVREPLPQDSPLRGLPNAILTPHMVGHTRESYAAVPVITAQNVRHILAGEPPVYTCNPTVISRWRSKWVEAS